MGLKVWKKFYYTTPNTRSHKSIRKLVKNKVKLVGISQKYSLLVKTMLKHA